MEGLVHHSLVRITIVIELTRNEDSSLLSLSQDSELTHNESESFLVSLSSPSPDDYDRD